MHRPSLTGQLGRRLLQLGFPVDRVPGHLREVAEHYDDLKQAALEEGLSEEQAEARATELLGKPEVLAEQFVLALRRSSWWGRHRFLGFCLLPPIALTVAFIAAAAIVFPLASWCVAHHWLTPDGGRTGFVPLAAGAVTAHVFILALGTLLFCRLAQRAAAGRGWSLVVCAVCALQGGAFYFQVEPHMFSLGYSWPLNYLRALIPLVVGAGIVFRQKRMLKMLAPASGGVPAIE